MAEGGKDEDGERPQGQGSRPPFAEGFPRDAELDAVVDAFEAGDFGRVRAEVKRIASSATKDDAVKRAAEVVLARTKADPLQVGLVVVSALLLVALSAWWIAHSGKG